MRKILVLCTFLIAAIIYIAAKYFTQLESKGNNIEKVLNFIPGDAALVLNFDNNASFYEIFKNYELFNVIVGKHGRQELEQLKSFITQPALSEATADKKIFLSLHKATDSVAFLLSMNLDSKYSQADLTNTLLQTPGVSVINTSLNIFKWLPESKNHPLFIHIEQGVAIASFSGPLFNSALNNKRGLSKQFAEEINKASSKSQSSPIQLFVNHESIIPFLNYFLKGKPNGNLSMFSNIKGTSALSMNFKSDALMFNGISSCDTLSKPHYFNIFLHQRAAPNQIKDILPVNTSNFLAFSMSDMSRFQKDLMEYHHKTGQLARLENQLKNIQTSAGVLPDRDLKLQFDKEFVSVTNSYEEKFAIIKVSNGRSVKFTLQLISRLVDEEIGQLNYADIFYYYFGDPLKSFSKPYFAIADNYLIIANTPGIIRNFLSDYQNERFLSETKEFKEYDKLVADQSNIFYFIQTKNSRRTLASSLKEKYSTLFSDDNSALKRFYGLSYQWTGDGDHFFSNIYLSYPPPDTTTFTGE